MEQYIKKKVSLKMTKPRLWLTPLEIVEIIQVNAKGIITKRTEVDAFEAVSYGVIALHKQGLHGFTFTDKLTGEEWEVEFNKQQRSKH